MRDVNNNPPAKPIKTKPTVVKKSASKLLFPYKTKIIPAIISVINAMDKASLTPLFLIINPAIIADTKPMIPYIKRPILEILSGITCVNDREVHMIDAIEVWETKKADKIKSNTTGLRISIPKCEKNSRIFISEVVFGCLFLRLKIIMNPITVIITKIM